MERTCESCGRKFGLRAKWQRHCDKCAGAAAPEPAAVISKQGYFIEPGEGRFEHRIAGEHGIKGAACKCKAPLLLMLTLDLRDPKLSFIPKIKRRASGRVKAYQLPLFYCWRCGVNTEYLLMSNGALDIFGYTTDYTEHPNHPTSLPASDAILIAVSKKTQALIKRRNALKANEVWSHDKLPSPRHQVGGEPYLAQGGEDAGGVCPGCRDSIPVLATASDDAGGGRSFIGNSGVEVVFSYCGRCQIVSAWNECD